MPTGRQHIAQSGEIPDPRLIATAERLTEALQRLRARSGLSVRATAKATGVPLNTVADYTSGRSVPSIRSHLETLLRFWGVADDEIGAWFEAVDRVRRRPGPRSAGDESPYRGLAPYEAEHARFFFGRVELTARLVSVARAQCGRGQPVIVVGASGSGKSSLLRAGLGPALTGSTAGRCKQWHCLITTPGTDPWTRFEQAVDSHDVACAPATAPDEPPGHGDPTVTVESANTADATSEDNPPRPSGRVDRLLRRLAVDERPRLVVVDQFEEILGDGATPDARSFVELLLALAGRPRTVVVLGMRADFYQLATNDARLAPILQNTQVVVGPMDEDEIRQVILEPARLAGLTIDEGLVEALIRDLPPMGETGALPLLSHALHSTWQGARGRRLSLDSYLATGRIIGAVAATAERVYTSFPPQLRELTRRLFVRLVHVDNDTRRRIRRDEILSREIGHAPDQVQHILDLFVRERLVTVDGDTVEITHEALIDAWPRLREWLDADRTGRRVHRQLTLAAQSWRDGDREPSGLYSGATLIAAESWATENGNLADLNPLEREFLLAGVARRTDEQTTERRRLRRRYQLAGVVLVLVMATTGLVAYNTKIRGDAAREGELSLSRQLSDTVERLRGRDVSLAMQLAVVAHRLAPTPEARAALLNSTAMPSGTRLGPTDATARTVASSRDGGLLAAGTREGGVRLWSGSDGTLTPGPAVIDGFTDAVDVIATSADGSRLVAAAGETTRIWDVGDPATPVELAPVPDGIPDAVAAALDADGRLLAVAGSDHLVRLWRIEGGEPTLLASLQGPTAAVTALTFSPDGRTVVAGSHDTDVHRWDVSEPAAPRPLPVLSRPTSRVFSVAFSPDGRHLAAGTGAERAVHVWDLTAAPDGPGRVLTGPVSWVNTVGFDADGTTILGGSSDSNLWAWDLDTGEETGRMPHPSPVTGVVRLGDDLVGSVATDGVVRAWDLAGPVVSGFADAVFAVNFDASGRSMATFPGSADNRVRLWDVDSGRETWSTPPQSAPGAASDDEPRFSGAGAMTPDGRTILAGDLDGRVHVWHTEDGGREPSGTPFDVSENLIEAVTVRPDGRLAAVSTDDSTVSLVDLADPRRPEVVATMSEAEGYVYGTAFSPDGRLLAAASQDDNVYLWDIADPAEPRLLATLEGFTKTAYAPAFNATGDLLAVGGADVTVRMWDVSDPQAPRALDAVLRGPVNEVLSIAFHPRRDTLAVASTDGTVWLWDLADRADPVHQATLTGPADGLLTTTFTPDGSALAAGGRDRAVRLWLTDPDAATDWICERVGVPITEREWAQYVPDLPYSPPCPP